MDVRLEGLVSSNGGFFLRGDAMDSGWNVRELGEAWRLGIIRRLGQGLYSPAEIYDACDEVGRHVILARAALARQVGAVALTGISAAAVHGLCLYGRDLSTVHLVRLDGGSSRRQAGVCHHVVGDAVSQQVEVRSGVLVTNVPRTVWESVVGASLEVGVATADSALRLYPQIRPDLDELSHTFENRPGSRTARTAVKFADGRAESPGESITRVVFHEHGVPAPRPQQPVVDQAGRVIGWADFGWEEDRHLGEFDGKVKYGRLVRDGESPGDVVFREKRREDAMREELWGMTRWVWQDLMSGQQAKLVHRVNRDRERSRRLYLHNRVVIA